MRRRPDRVGRQLVGAWVRIATAAAVAAVPVTVGVAGVPGGRASADVVEPLSLTYEEALYGDFVHIGNGVMTCPPGGTSTFTPLLCQDGQNRTAMSALNDLYDMRWNDPDGTGPRFNASSGELTVPPGATVEYVQASWSGGTGVFRDSGGQLHGPVTGDPACGAHQQLPGDPSTIPAGSPQSQSVSVSVDGGAAVAVAPDVFVGEPVPTDAGAQYYSAHADVTGLFTGVTTGVPLTVEVADVWTPEGYNCFGGWSLTLVYSYPEPEPTHAPHLRQVYVYTGHVRQYPANPDTDTVISGFTYAGGDIQLGMTAYEGNWGIAGDYLEINGTALSEPQINVTNNFFISATDGSVSPDVPNNFSVDAKSTEIPEASGLIPLDASSADLAFGTSGDAYMAQLLVFSVPVAELRVDKEVCDSADAADCGPGGPGPWGETTTLPLGETAYWRLTVTNRSGLDITDATVTDDTEPSCSQAAGTFDIGLGDSRSFYCATRNVTDAVTNTVTTSFVPPGSPGGTPPTVSLPSEATAHPYGMSVSKQVCGSRTAAACGPGGDGPWADQGAVTAGDTAYWRITVRNIGTVSLQDATLMDDVEPACARAAAGTFDLAVGQTRHFFCATPDVTAPLANVATVAAPPPPQAPPDAPPSIARGTAEVQLAGALVNTGSVPLGWLLAAGAALVVAGGAIVLLVRRPGRWRNLVRC